VLGEVPSFVIPPGPAEGSGRKKVSVTEKRLARGKVAAAINGGATTIERENF
jgi:hypothetical protein